MSTKRKSAVKLIHQTVAMMLAIATVFVVGSFAYLKWAIDSAPETRLCGFVYGRHHVEPDQYTVDVLNGAEQFVRVPVPTLEMFEQIRDSKEYTFFWRRGELVRVVAGNLCEPGRQI